jgi:hypothetical protein
VFRQFDGAILKLFDVNIDIFGGMPLVFYVQVEISQFCDDAGYLLVRQAQEDSIVNVVLEL